MHDENEEGRRALPNLGGNFFKVRFPKKEEPGIRDSLTANRVYETRAVKKSFIQLVGKPNSRLDSSIVIDNNQNSKGGSREGSIHFVCIEDEQIEPAENIKKAGTLTSNQTHSLSESKTLNAALGNQNQSQKFSEAVNPRVKLLKNEFTPKRSSQVYSLSNGGSSNLVSLPDESCLGTGSHNGIPGTGTELSEAGSLQGIKGDLNINIPNRNSSSNLDVGYVPGESQQTINLRAAFGTPSPDTTDRENLIIPYSNQYKDLQNMRFSEDSITSIQKGLDPDSLDSDSKDE